MLSHEYWSMQRRMLLMGSAAIGASVAIGGSQAMPELEQNTLKRRGVGLRACEPKRAFAGFTLFAPHFVESRTVYLVDLQGEVVHTWNMPYPPGLSGCLTERGTLFYNGRTSEQSFLSRFPFKGGVVLEADWSGKVLWEVRHPDHHHHGILLRNGNVLLHCMGEVPEEIARRVKGGMAEGNMQSGQYASRRSPKPTRCTPIIWLRSLLRDTRFGNGAPGNILIPSRTASPRCRRRARCGLKAIASRSCRTATSLPAIGRPPR